jgi:hypothetical protein
VKRSMPNRMHRVAAIVASLAIVLAGVVTSLSLLATSPGSAAVASTDHAHPNRGVAGVTYLCGPTVGYSCTPGYTGTNATGWAAADYGCPNYASGCPGTPHNCTLYAAVRLMKNGYGNPGWSANANDWALEASRHGVTVDQSPHVGAIAQWNLGVGHVAYVEASDSSGITLTMDDYYTSSPWPVGYTAEIHISPGSPAWPDNFIHFDDQGAAPTSTPTPAPSPQPQSGATVTVVNANGGVYWRSGTDWNTPIADPGYGVYNGDRVELLCWQRGAADTPPYDNNPLWYQAAVISGEGKGQGWVNDHFLDTGLNAPNVPVSGVPTCQAAPPATSPPTAPTPAGSSGGVQQPTAVQPAGGGSLQPAGSVSVQPAGGSSLQPQGSVSVQPAGGSSLQPQGSVSVQPAGGTTQLLPPQSSGAPDPGTTAQSSPTSTGNPVPAVSPVATPAPAPTTYSETVGGTSHTWSDFSDAGGTAGPSIAAFTTVQIACKVTGFQVSDSNTGWYRIASSPWNNDFYVSADAFYNNGSTSGSLHGTPFVDTNVPNC